MLWLSLCAEWKQWQIYITLLILMAFMQVTKEGSDHVQLSVAPSCTQQAEDSACWPGQQ